MSMHDNHPAAPTISVVMSVHNGGGYLRAAIESILAQTWTDFEFLIIDDGSTDASLAILREYRDQDRRITLLENTTNIGLTRSLNRGLRRARGRYIARQDADDISYPHRLETEKLHLDRHPATVLVSCEMDMLDEDGKRLTTSRLTAPPILLRWYLLFYNRIGGHSQVMFRREAVERLGGYDEGCRFSQDYALWLRMTGLGQLVILPEVLSGYRCAHRASITRTKGSQQLHCALRAGIDHIRAYYNIGLTLEEMQRLRTFWMGGQLTHGQNVAAQEASLILWRKFRELHQPPTETAAQVGSDIAAAAINGMRGLPLRVRLREYPATLRRLTAISRKAALLTLVLLLGRMLRGILRRRTDKRGAAFAAGSAPPAASLSTIPELSATSDDQQGQPRSATISRKGAQ